VTWNRILAQLASLEWWPIALLGSAGISIVTVVVMLIFDTASIDYRESDDRVT
jgi:hypothetical protein